MDAENLAPTGIQKTQKVVVERTLGGTKTRRDDSNRTYSN
jgi:hypothetical protein